MQVKHFPDFESRASLEKQQAIIYQKAVKKIKEYQRISPLLNNYQKWLTAEEKSSIDYFHGTGIYAKFQDPKTPPNILDTRKTFLKKMENQDMREKFLETYNRVNLGKIRPVKPFSHSHQNNIPSNEEKGLNRPNFITLGKISDEEKIEIIQKGFQLNQEGKISLKKYYESTQNSIE